MKTKGPRPHVLIVDDEPDIREMLEEGLSRSGFEASSAASGHDAMVRLREEHFDVVVTDISMFDGDGIELVESLKADPGHKPLVVFITGHPDFTVEDAQQIGAATVFTKPFTGESLVRFIRQHLPKAAASG